MHRDSPEDIKNRQRAQEQLSPEGRQYFKFIEFDAEEELITEIRKHPMGLVIILATGGFVMLMLLLAGVFAASFDYNSSLGVDGINGFRTLFVLLGLLLVIGAGIMTFIAAFLYRSNVIFITNEKIAQVVYLSLFNRKISQLSIGDVQDVTVTQKGILSHLFNYGTLVIETAGEQENYRFTYVPDPYQTSKAIVGAHEQNLKLHGN